MVCRTLNRLKLSPACNRNACRGKNAGLVFYFDRPFGKNATHHAPSPPHHKPTDAIVRSQHRPVATLGGLMLLLPVPKSRHRSRWIGFTGGDTLWVAAARWSAPVCGRARPDFARGPRRTMHNSVWRSDRPHALRSLDKNHHHYCRPYAHRVL